MKRSISVLILIAVCALMVFGQGISQNQDRFRINVIEPDGFLGLRLGNSFRFAEDTLGEPTVVRNGSLEWHFSSPDYDPYLALTILGDKKKISGFIAQLRPNRIQFTEMKLHPEPNKLGLYHASKRYMLGKREVAITVVGDDATYATKIILQEKAE